MTAIRTVIVATALVLALAACGRDEESATGAGNALLDFVPADTPYLAANLEPLPEDVVDAYLDELSRLEFEPEHVAAIFKVPRNYSGEDRLLFKVTSVGMFLFKDRLIVVAPEVFPLFDGKPFQKVARLQSLFLRLVYRSISHFLEHLKIINMITDDLESKINTSMENRYLLNLFTLEKGMVYYLNSIHANSALIERVKNNAAKINFTPEELEFLDDMMIENSQCSRQAEIHSNILAGLMDARASIVNNNLNVLIKTLNIITIGIMVPTFVVSAFSMNVDLPFNRAHPFAFWGILMLALVSVCGFYLFVRKKLRT